MSHHDIIQSAAVAASKPAVAVTAGIGAAVASMFGQITAAQVGVVIAACGLVVQTVLGLARLWLDWRKHQAEMRAIEGGKQ